MLSLLKSWNYKGNFQQLKEILKLVIPQNKQEAVLLTLLFFFYALFGFVIAHGTSIQDYPLKQCDLYFSFDAGFIFHQGKSYQNSIHPLLKLFCVPIIYILDNITVLVGNYKIKTYILTMLCNSLISMSIIYIYRYLKEIVCLKGYIVYLLIVFYSIFFTNLILSFTTETYTISIFLLSFMVYYYSHCIITNKQVKLLPSLAFTFFLGGITITNSIKGIIPILFTKDKLHSIFRKIGIIAVLLIVAATAYLFVNNINLLNEVDTRIKYVSTEQDKTPYLEYIASFVGTPIIFSELHTRPVQLEWINYPLQLIEVKFLNQLWQYIFISVLVLLLLASIIRNRHNKIVLLITSLFSVDILIHVIFRYGASEPYIYGGHWIYIVPLLLGWLYKSLGNKSSVLYLILLTLICGILVINNIFNLVSFTNLAKELYPSFLRNIH